MRRFTRRRLLGASAAAALPTRLFAQTVLPAFHLPAMEGPDDADEALDR